MYRLRTVLPTALAVLLLAPSGVALQAPVDSLREMIREFTALEERFERVQDAALDSFPDLRERQERVTERIHRVMEEIDPGVLRAQERLERLPADLSEARRGRNAREVQRLLVESRESQLRVEVARADAMATHEVFEAIQAYRAELLQRMREVDPEILGVMMRIDELKERIADLGGETDGGSRLGSRP